MRTIDIIRYIAAVVLVVGYGIGLWLVIRPTTSFWMTVLWLAGCYIALAAVYSIRQVSGVGAMPVRIVNNQD